LKSLEGAMVGTVAETGLKPGARRKAGREDLAGIAGQVLAANGPS